MTVKAILLLGLEFGYPTAEVEVEVIGVTNREEGTSPTNNVGVMCAVKLPPGWTPSTWVDDHGGCVVCDDYLMFGGDELLPPELPDVRA